jgi:hypothetical protein
MRDEDVVSAVRRGRSMGRPQGRTRLPKGSLDTGLLALVRPAAAAQLGALVAQESLDISDEVVARGES